MKKHGESRIPKGIRPISGLPTDTGVLGSTSVGNRSRLLVGVGTYDCSEMGDNGLA